MEEIEKLFSKKYSDNVQANAQIIDGKLVVLEKRGEQDILEGVCIDIIKEESKSICAKKSINIYEPSPFCNMESSKVQDNAVTRNTPV